jgi:hypothetical protein
MTQTSTTIWEAARDRFAEWALVARTQDGSRSLPGSPRLTDQDIWLATNRFVATDKSQCGSATTETARPGREDVSKVDRGGMHRDLLEVRSAHPPPPWLTFLRVVPQGGEHKVNLCHAKS